MNILVTGATGLIGSRIVRHLLKDSHEVTGLSLRGGNIDKAAAPRFSLIACDLAGEGEILTRLPGQAYDAVIHCASQQPREGLCYPSYHRANVTTLDLLLDWMGRYDTRNIISLSTVAFHEFSSLSEMPMDESSPVNPSNFYALSKYTAEQLLRIRAEQEGFHALCLRLPSVFIEEQKGGIVHTYYEQARSGKNVEIYGEGRYKRNLIYIDEILQGIDKGLICIRDMRGFHPLLLGGTESLSMKEIAEHIYHRLRSSGRIRLVPTEPPIPGHWIFNLSAARAKLGFEPADPRQRLNLYLENMQRMLL